MKRPFFWLLTTFAGICLCFTLACQRKSHIELFIDVGGKVLLHVQKGDVIRWTQGGAGSAGVRFPHGTPCSNADGSATCTVQADRGFYTYECAGCQDPVIVVGSTVFVNQFRPTGLAGLTRAAIYTGIYCQAAAAGVAPNPVVADQGDSIRWYGDGVVTQWKVTVPAGCANGTTFDQNNPLCTLAGAAGASYPYTLHADACKVNPDFNGEIQIR
jgi:hypothetical protein